MGKVVAVIAANGRAGQAFVSAALRAGMRVRAGYYSENTLPPHDNLVAVKCDATRESDIRSLLSGADVVVSLIGHVKNSPARVQTESIKTISNVMHDLGIKRIISLTGTGVRLPGDTPSAIDKLLNVIIKRIDPERISDGIAHAEFLAATDLDWTIVRVLKLTNNTQHAGRVKFSPHGPAELLTSRDRVARGILQIIAEDSHKKAAPVIRGES